MNNDINILIMFVQVTTTLMGFAILTPMVQAISTKLFSKAQTFIDERILYKKLLIFVSFPVLVFLGPFISSLLLLIIGESIQIAITVGSFAFAMFCLLLDRQIKNYTGLKEPGLIIKMFEDAPRISLVLYLICALALAVICYLWNFISFFYWIYFFYLTNLLFIVVGLLFLIRSIMTPFEKGVWFNPSELKNDFEDEVKNNFTEIEKALKDRKEVIKQPKELPMSAADQEGKIERHQANAKLQSQLNLLHEQYEGPENAKWDGLRDLWKNINCNSFDLCRLRDFDDKRLKMLEDHLPEFKRATEERNIILGRIKAEHESDNKPSCLFSVVIPTQGRSNLIEKLLISLQRAITQSKVVVEVIIVDDSPPAERDKIKSLCLQYSASYLSGPPNVREKRNCGIEKSKGEIILFIDSDCEVSQNIFEEHLKLYDKADAAGVLGITEFTGKETITWKIVSRTMFLDSFSFAKTLNKITDSAPWGTCTNLSFRKEVLEDVGKFDTTFPFRLGGDDTELGVRINEAGYKIKMNPDAVVFHTRETWSKLSALIERAFRWGRADFHILKRHPQLGHVAFPNFFTTLLFIALASLAYILTDHSDIAVIIIITWIISVLLVEAIIKVIRAGEKPSFVFFELVATLLNLVFDAGTVFESLRRGSISMLYKKIIYTPAQLIFEWESEAVRSWSIAIGLLLTLIVVWTLKGV